MEKETEFSLIPLVLHLIRNRKLLVLFVAVMAVIGIAITILLPSKYRASATVIPVESQTGGDNLRALAGQLGFDMSTFGSQYSYSQLIPAILRSRAITEMIVDQKYPTTSEPTARPLTEIWRIEPESRLRYLDDEVQVLNQLCERINESLRIRTDRETGAIEVMLETNDPLLSANLVNSLVGSLEQFLVDFRLEEAQQRKTFITGRSEDVENELEQAEEALKSFRENNLQRDRSATLLMQEARLQRDVNVLEGVFITLQQEYERARIDASMEYPPVRILDLAIAPLERYSPRLLLNILLSVAIGLFLGIVAIFVRQYWIASFKEGGSISWALQDSMSDLKRNPSSHSQESDRNTEDLQ